MTENGALWIGGIPVVTSPEAANKLILIDANRLVVVDGLLEVAGSSIAAVELESAPTNSAATGLGAALVSGFQGNVTFVRALRYLWWTLMAENAVAFTTIDVSGS